MKKICSVSYCDKVQHAKGFCTRHYRQMKTTGKIHRTRTDKNEFVILDDYAIMYLYDSSGEKIAETLIDIEDIPRIKDFRWSLWDRKLNYVVTGKNIRLHRFVLDYTGELLVDHINRNPLDNRKSNLRLVTRSQNIQNTKIRTDNSSGVRGVFYDKSSNKWVAEITFNKKRIYKRFKTKEEAIQTRIELELKYHGEYSPLWNGGKH